MVAEVGETALCRGNQGSVILTSVSYSSFLLPTKPWKFQDVRLVWRTERADYQHSSIGKLRY